MANYDKSEVIPAAQGLWKDIMLKLTDINPSIMNHRKEHPCPLCGGKTRFRYEPSYEAPFFCNKCGGKTGIQFLIAYTGMKFAEAIDCVGAYLSLIPVERREAVKREFASAIHFGKNYNFDQANFDIAMAATELGVSQWQRVIGCAAVDLPTLNGFTIAHIISNQSGRVVDAALIDIDGNINTSGGMNHIPNDHHVAFGVEPGRNAYIANNIEDCLAASIATGKRVLCATGNGYGSLVHAIENRGLSIMAIVNGNDSVLDADSYDLLQLRLNGAGRTVNKRIYQPGEIMERKQ